MNQVESQSILAKCLATENIDVIHDANMPTAAFDVKNRKLFLPIWKEMSKDLYDLLIGHEVGHAHETPEAGWHDTVIDDPSKKAFLNVVEDVRIERKVKARYPGLVKSFSKGYKELFDKDFFGVQDLDVQDLPLVDRVNLHFKVGHLLGVQFKDGFEKDLVERIGKADTWEEVMKLADELYDNHQEERKEKQEEYDELLEKLMPHRFTPEGQKQMSDREEKRQEAKDKIQEEKDKLQEAYDKEQDRRRQLRDEAWDKGEDFDESQFQDKNGNDEHEDKNWEGQTYEQRREFEDREQEIENEKAKDKATEVADQKVKDRLDEIQKFLDEKGHSISDSNYRQNEESLREEDPKETVYAKPFKGFDVSEIIIPMDELYNWDDCAELTKIEKNEDDEYGYWKETEMPSTELPGIAETLWKEYQRKQGPIINQMAQQFELRKAATAFKKARISKTGRLNEDKLWAYKLTEDLFQQSQIVPNGKNHGILMYVDMSGSMHRNFLGTLQQMETVAMFCRKVNIPFDVYGFSSTGKKGIYEEEDSVYSKEGLEGHLTLANRGFSMVHILSSKANKKSWNNAMKYLQIMKLCFERNRYYSDLVGATAPYYGYVKNDHFRLGSTPLNNCIISAVDIAKRFQKKYNVEKLTSIFLTDGDATDRVGTWQRNSEGEMVGRGIEGYNKRLVIKDGATTVSCPSNPNSYRDTSTVTLLEFYKAKTESVMINFHILESGKRYQFEDAIRNNEWMKGDKARDYFHFDDSEWKKVLKDKFVQVNDKYGYHARFLLKGRDDLKIQDQELTVKSNKKGDLLRGFRAFNKGKSSQRTFLNQIIELVA